MRKLNKNDTRLSPSSASTLRGCEQKWVHYKVNDTKYDDDYEEGDSLKIGKAFHWIIEQTEHKYPKRIVPLLKACSENEEILLDKDQYALVVGMVYSYTKYHAKSGLSIVAIEEAIEDEKFNGHIDAIMMNKKEQWWICDNKTFAYFSPSQVSQFANHVQMNLYSYFAPQLAEEHDLDINKFMGCRLFITTKPRVKRKKDETIGEMAERLKELCATWDVEIPIGSMDPKLHMSLHDRLYTRSLDLRKGNATPSRNYDHCMSYFRPCQYWSNCHGSTYSEGTSGIKTRGGI